MQTATVDPLVGRTLEGRYRIIERIARGGMSTVYSAVDERLDRLVAVKVMSSALSADPAFSDRFTREARAAARLTHLNAVSVYDQGTDVGPAGHHVFLVMELVEGRTLRELLRERGRLTPAEAVSIMEPVLSALSAAHHAGLVHRDVKPENILLSDDGVVKVADFGLARAVESDAAATRTGLMMGTVAYCAPEQISKGRADQRSDVYSAGIVLFELLTGRPPYQGDSAMTVAYQHVHSRVPAPSSVVPGIPEELDELVVSVTDSDPGGRPIDAGAFLAQVADVRADLALPVVPVPARERVAPRARARATEAPTGLVRRPGDTTDVIGATGHHDTSVVMPGAGRASGRIASPQPQAHPQAHPQPHPSSPPPPVVTAPKRRRRKPVSTKVRRRRRAMIAMLIVLLLGLTALWGGWWLAAGRYSSIPAVGGMSRTAAVNHLRSAGYKVNPAVDTQFSESVPQGAVISTKPSIGSRVPRGRTVSLVVSAGKERFKVPTVAGKSEADARTALAAIPIAIKTRHTTSDTVAKNAVIGTEPAAGTLVKRDSPVTIVISDGPPIITIPSIDPGTPFDLAKQRLEAIGFKVTRADADSQTVPIDGVISVAPLGSAPKGSTITVTASAGVKIPQFANLAQLDDVRSALEALGLKVKVHRLFGGALNIVRDVSPASGSHVEPGSTVTVTVV